jgi:hypothetical protein
MENRNFATDNLQANNTERSAFVIKQNNSNITMLNVLVSLEVVIFHRTTKLAFAMKNYTKNTTYYYLV